MPLSYASKGITMYYYVLSLPAPDVLQILCRRRSGNAARTVGKKKVDRCGVVRLLYKQIGRTSCLSDLGHCSRSRLMQFGVDLRSGHINNIQGRRAIEIGE